MAIQTTNITLDGLVHTLDDRDRVAAQLVAENDNIFTGTLNHRRKVDNTTLNTGGAVTTTLTAAQSGTHFNVDGTGNIVINMPALSTGNVGLHYSFLLTTAVGGATTVTWVLPGSAVSNFYGNLDLIAGSAANTVYDIAGDTLTWSSAVTIGARVELLCVADDGTNSTWQAWSASTPIATID